MRLTIDDLQKVLEALNSASHKWFFIGLKLGLTNAFLDGLESQYKDNVTCLRKMLAEVLNTRHVTWVDIADALRAPTVNLIPLADAIAPDHKKEEPVHKAEVKPKDGDDVLTVDHLTEEFLDILNEARDNWYFIGKGIGCKLSDLDNISKKWLNDEKRCMFEMLKARIQQGGLTRSSLCKSLRGSFVGRDDIAQKIEKL